MTLIYSMLCSSSVLVFIFQLHGHLLLDFLDQYFYASCHIALLLRRSFLQMLIRATSLFPLWFLLKAPIYCDGHKNLPLSSMITVSYADQYNLIVTFYYPCSLQPPTVSCIRLQSVIGIDCPYVHHRNRQTEP